MAMSTWQLQPLNIAHFKSLIHFSAISSGIEHENVGLQNHEIYFKCCWDFWISRPNILEWEFERGAIMCYKLLVTFTSLLFGGLDIGGNIYTLYCKWRSWGLVLVLFGTRVLFVGHVDNLDYVVLHLFTTGIFVEILPQTFLSLQQNHFGNKCHRNFK